MYLKYSRKNNLNWTRTAVVINVFLLQGWSTRTLHTLTIGPGYIFQSILYQWFRTKGSDIMGTVLRYLFLHTELLWGAGTRPSSAHLEYSWYPSTLLYYPVLVSTTGTLQYLNFTCASLWRPSHGTFCTGITLDYYQSLSHASR
jgi:hypothetical protein